MHVEVEPKRCRAATKEEKTVFTTKARRGRRKIFRAKAWFDKLTTLSEIEGCVKGMRRAHKREAGNSKSEINLSDQKHKVPNNLVSDFASVVSCGSTGCSPPWDNRIGPLSRRRINHVTLRHYGTEGSSCGLERCGRAQSRFRAPLRFPMIRRGFD
jgi:hypothetical protein